MEMADSNFEEGAFFRSIAIIGLGLIGGSMAKALRCSGYAGTLVGIDFNFETRQMAFKSGLFEVVSEKISELSFQVDLIILAVPLGKIKEALENGEKLIGPDTLITDVGSVKATVHDAVQEALKCKVNFIGGHPMAGSEQSGFINASALLFKDAYYFLTRGTDVSEYQLASIRQLIKRVGAIPVLITPYEHDVLVAKLSHLPHLVACALISTFTKTLSPELLKYAGGGFRDTTRIAMGDPTVWRDIFTQNKQEISLGIDGLIDELLTFKHLLMEEENESVIHHLSQTQKIRSQMGLITCL